MPYRSLTDFLEALADSDQLVRVSTEVDPVLEIAEITDRSVKSEGPALLFDHVRDSSIAVVTNLFGTHSRIRLAAEVTSLEAIPERIVELSHSGARASWLGRFSTPQSRAIHDRYRPQQVNLGACQQVVHLGRDVDLRKLPALQSWPEESARAITSGLLITGVAESDQGWVGRCTLPVLDQNTLAVAWDPYCDAQRHWEAAQRHDHNLPVAVVLGGDPLAMLSIDLPAPPEMDRFTFAGMLRREPIEMVACRTHSLNVPAEAEIVIEGFVKPGTAADRALPSTLAAPTGFYCRPHQMHAVHVKAVTHRTNPVVPSVVWGRPPNDHTAIQGLVERMLLPEIQQVAPEVTDLGLPSWSADNHCAFVAIRKTFPHQARKVASALWGLTATMRTKAIVLLDDDVDVHDTDDVMFHVAANVDPGRDLFFYGGPSAPFDHALLAQFEGSPQSGNKMGVDATAKRVERPNNTWPQKTKMSDSIRDLVDQRWQEYRLDFR